MTGAGQRWATNLSPGRRRRTRDSRLAVFGWGLGQVASLIALWNQECLTVDSVILTKRGWLAHDQVRPGDETIGYDPVTGRSEWTPILRVVRYDDAEVWRIGGPRWHADVTPGHRWWSDAAVRRRRQDHRDAGQAHPAPPAA